MLAIPSPHSLSYTKLTVTHLRRQQVFSIVSYAYQTSYSAGIYLYVLAAPAAETAAVPDRLFSCP